MTSVGLACGHPPSDTHQLCALPRDFFAIALLRSAARDTLYPRPIGKRCINPTAPIKAFVNQVEHSLEARRRKSPDKPGTSREAPVSPNQMLASRGH